MSQFRVTTGFLVFSVILYSSGTSACDSTQLAAQFIGFYQTGTVKVCPSGYDPRASSNKGDPCKGAVVSTNDERAKQILGFVQNKSEFDLKEAYQSWAAIHDSDTEVRKHLAACTSYDTYLKVARHMVSCYSHVGGQTVGYGKRSPPEAQAIGIPLCVEIGK